MSSVVVSLSGGKVDSSPAIANGIVYVGSEDKQVYALNATIGDRLWSYATGDMVVSSPAVVDGVVYVGSYDHLVYAIGVPTQNRQSGPDQSFIGPQLVVIASVLLACVVGVFLYRRKSQVSQAITESVP